MFLSLYVNVIRITEPILCINNIILNYKCVSVSAEKEKENKDVCSFFTEVKSVLKEIKLDDVTLESAPTSLNNDQERTEGKVVLKRV